jgi:hypothetical protein
MTVLAKITRLTPRRVTKAMQRKLQCWQLRGARVECPLCAFQGERLADGSWHVRSVCPRCSAETRHRLLAAALTLLPEYGCDELLAGKRVMHFAPEKVFRKFILAQAGLYASADLLRGDVDFQLDISCMPEIEDGSFDCCIACDVLEHVPNDRAALSELHRVLSPGGTAIITVPQKNHAATTYEDATITTPRGRTRAFGQHDHVRIYGDDVVERMRAAGFEVEIVDDSSFESADVERFVLRPPVLSEHPLATNFRKVFFCRRK